MLTKSCAECSTIFEKPVNCSLREWTDQRKFCSRECYWRAKRETLICIQCGQEFHRKWYGATKQKLCSRKCRADLQRKPLPFCEECGKPCKKHRARFCSRACKVIWYRGENVYNYLGDDAREFPKELVWLTFWKERAQEIRDRDTVCRHCGKTPTENGRALDVHHRIPYRISQDNSHSNLIALCKSCHKTADHELNR